MGLKQADATQNMLYAWILEIRRLTLYNPEIDPREDNDLLAGVSYL